MVDRIGGLSASRHGLLRRFVPVFLPFLRFLRRKNFESILQASGRYPMRNASPELNKSYT
jgi:hypothetical protein